MVILHYTNNMLYNMSVGCWQQTNLLYNNCWTSQHLVKMLSSVIASNEQIAQLVRVAVNMLYNLSMYWSFVTNKLYNNNEYRPMAELTDVSVLPTNCTTNVHTYHCDKYNMLYNSVVQHAVKRGVRPWANTCRAQLVYSNSNRPMPSKQITCIPVQAARQHRSDGTACR